MSDLDVRTELANEAVDDAELRELLERLTAADLGDVPHTLGAVVEATGAPLEQVAAHLAAMRRGTDPQLEQRVRRLEARVFQPEPAEPEPVEEARVAPEVRPRYRRKGAYQLPEIERPTDGWFVVVCVTMIVVAIVLFYMAGR